MNKQPESLNVPPVDPRILEMQRMDKEGFRIVLEKIREQVKTYGPIETVELPGGGKLFPVRLGSDTDISVAEAQRYHRAATEILENIRGGDYYQERAAAKLVEFFAVNRDLEERYAELQDHYPESVAIIDSMTSPVKEKKIQGDHKYLVR